MRIADVIKRAGRNLRQAKGRTILTSLAISVGAFTIALAMAGELIWTTWSVRWVACAISM